MRQEKAAEAELREKERQKAHTVEVDNLKLELLKKELEIKKIQAATLTRAAKVSSTDRSKNSTTRVASFPNNAEEEDEPSLFIPEDSPPKETTIVFPKQGHTESDIGKSHHADQGGIGSSGDVVYDVDGRTHLRAESTGPTSMAAVFAKSKPTQRNSYHEDRERWLAKRRADEEKKRSEAAKARLASRFASAPPEKPPQEQLELMKQRGPAKERAKALKKSRPVPKPKPSSKEPRETFASATNLSQSPIIGNPSSQPPEVKAPATLLPPPPQKKVYTSEVRLITDVERENIENKRKAQKATAKQKSNEDRRKKDAEKVRLNRRQKLLEDADKGGFSFSEAELNYRVEAYMKEREVSHRFHDFDR